MENGAIIRRSVDYGSDRRSSSYLIHGSSGYRFAKCSISDAVVLPPKDARKMLKNLKRKDSLNWASRYYVEVLN